MIENPTEKIPEEELPPISPEHSPEEVHQAVLNLHSIAKQLRQKRFVDGALRLDQVSESFCSLHPSPAPKGKKLPGGLFLLACFPSHSTTPW